MDSMAAANDEEEDEEDRLDFSATLFADSYPTAAYNEHDTPPPSPIPQLHNATSRTNGMTDDVETEPLIPAEEAPLPHPPIQRRRRRRRERLKRRAAEQEKARICHNIFCHLPR